MPDINDERDGMAFAQMFMLAALWRRVLLAEPRPAEAGDQAAQETTAHFKHLLPLFVADETTHGPALRFAERMWQLATMSLPEIGTGAPPSMQRH